MSILSEMTRIPLNQGQFYHFMGGKPGFAGLTYGQLQKGGIAAGMVGTLHPLPGHNFRMIRDVQFWRDKKNGMFAPGESYDKLPGEMQYGPVMRFNPNGNSPEHEWHLVRADQLALPGGIGTEGTALSSPGPGPGPGPGLSSQMPKGRVFGASDVTDPDQLRIAIDERIAEALSQRGLPPSGIGAGFGFHPLGDERQGAFRGQVNPEDMDANWKWWGNIGTPIEHIPGVDEQPTAPLPAVVTGSLRSVSPSIGLLSAPSSPQPTGRGFARLSPEERSEMGRRGAAARAAKKAARAAATMAGQQHAFHPTLDMLQRAEGDYMSPAVLGSLSKHAYTNVSQYYAHLMKESGPLPLVPSSVPVPGMVDANEHGALVHPAAPVEQVAMSPMARKAWDLLVAQHPDVFGKTQLRNTSRPGARYVPNENVIELPKNWEEVYAPGKKSVPLQEVVRGVFGPDPTPDQFTAFSLLHEAGHRYDMLRRGPRVVDDERTRERETLPDRDELAYMSPEERLCSTETVPSTHLGAKCRSVR